MYILPGQKYACPYQAFVSVCSTCCVWKWTCILKTWISHPTELPKLLMCMCVCMCVFIEFWIYWFLSCLLAWFLRMCLILLACLFFQTRSLLIQIGLIFTELLSQLSHCCWSSEGTILFYIQNGSYVPSISLTALGIFSDLWLLPKDRNLSTERLEHYSGSGIHHKYPSVECASYIDLSVEWIAFFLTPLLKPYHTISMGSRVLLAV